MNRAAIERLAALYDKHRQLTPEIVVRDARKPSSPLHSEFEWDPAAAHEIYLIDRARAIIRAAYIELNLGDDAPVKTREYVSVPMSEPFDDTSKPRRAYVRVTDALSVSDTREALLQDAIRDLNAFRRRYAQLSEMAKVIKVIDAVTEKPSTRRRKRA